MICSAAQRSSLAGPRRLGLAVRRQDEPAHRRRRVAAIVHEFVEVGIAGLGRVHAEGDQKVERVSWRQPGPRQGGPERDGGWRGVRASEQRRLEQVEPADLLVRWQRRAVGDVVGGAGERVERHHGRAMPGRDQRRRHGEILAFVVLARGDVDGARGHRRARTAWWRRAAAGDRRFDMEGPGGPGFRERFDTGGWRRRKARLARTSMRDGRNALVNHFRRNHRRTINQDGRERWALNPTDFPNLVRRSFPTFESVVG